MNRRNVDHASELAYAVGYHRALDHDLPSALAATPTRLPITRVQSDLVEAMIWPARKQRLSLEFPDPPICQASILERGGAADGSRPTRTGTDRAAPATDSRR